MKSGAVVNLSFGDGRHSHKNGDLGDAGRNWVQKGWILNISEPSIFEDLMDGDDKWGEMGIIWDYRSIYIYHIYISYIYIYIIYIYMIYI